MRTLMLGDVDHYVSPYMRGVKQAMALLSHEHAEVSIRLPAKVIEQRIRLWNPALVWTHMLLWPPPGSPSVIELIAVLGRLAREGVPVVIHDGDAKPATRYPHDISSWCSLALVNHGFDRSAWGVPVLRWPYFAMTQTEIAKPVERFRCALFFAGTMGAGPVYAQRTELLAEVRARGVDLKTPPPGENTLDSTAEVAVSAGAVLGFGRPDVPGWVDVRCFQYPGAGGILLHDDAQGYLEPWEHYVPYTSGSADSVVDALAKLESLSDDKRWSLRERAFSHVQQHHSSVARARQVFDQLGVA